MTALETVRVTFDRDHTHAGQSIARGEIHELEAHHVQWLIANGVAHLTPSTPRAKSRRDTTGEHDHANQPE